MTEYLLLLHLVAGFLALQARNLLGSVIFLAVVSLLSSLLFYHLNAPDVALTEAAVGAGVSTTLFVWLLHRTERRDDT
jgi:uncharacterized MnhB-related membrane protein